MREVGANLFKGLIRDLEKEASTKKRAPGGRLIAFLHQDNVRCVSTPKRLACMHKSYLFYSVEVERFTPIDASSAPNFYTPSAFRPIKIKLSRR